MNFPHLIIFGQAQIPPYRPASLIGPVSADSFRIRWTPLLHHAVRSSQCRDERLPLHLSGTSIPPLSSGKLIVPVLTDSFLQSMVDAAAPITRYARQCR